MRENRNDPDEASRNVIRFLFFNGVSATPLWDAGRVLPEDERWLRNVIGLNDTLVAELRVWTVARDALGSGLARPKALSSVDAHADDLVSRLNADLDLRFIAEHLHLTHE